MDFETCAELYLDDKRHGRKTIRLNTLEGYRSAIRVHLLPRWSGVEVESIGYADVQAWVDSFPGGRGAEKAYKTLRQMVRWAIAHRHVVMADPTVGVEVPRPAKRPSRTLTDSELNRMVYRMRGEAWEPVVLAQVTCGLRRCEAAALTWADIDLRGGEVRVTKGRHVVGGEVFVWGPKTEKSTRTVALPRFAVERLREIRRERRARPSELLCDLRPDAMSRRFRSWCRRNGFGGMTMMACRHTWATLAVKAGVPIEVVAMALGHTDITMCYTRYVKRSTDVFKAAQRRFSELVLGAATSDAVLDRWRRPVLVA